MLFFKWTHERFYQRKRLWKRQRIMVLTGDRFDRNYFFMLTASDQMAMRIFEGCAAWYVEILCLQDTINIDFEGFCWLLAFWHLSALILFKKHFLFWCCSQCTDILLSLYVMFILTWCLHPTNYLYFKWMDMFLKV